MQAKDIMSTRVVTVRGATPVSEIAGLLFKLHISAVPVVDEKDSLVGIVSEGDLIRRQEIGTEARAGSWWLNLLTDNSELARDYVKTHGKTAADVMTTGVITVQEDTPLREIAEILEKKHIKRVPVVRDGALVGIVSRANIVQQLASGRDIKITVPADDATVRDDVEKTLTAQPWASTGTTAVTVTDGAVELWGTIESEAERDATRIALEELSGVVSVEDHRRLASAIPARTY